MIPKIICFLFGHKLFSNIFTGKYAEITDRLTGQDITLPVMNRERNEMCPRCGINLVKEDEK